MAKAAHKSTHLTGDLLISESSSLTIMVADMVQRTIGRSHLIPQVSEDIEPGVVSWNFKAYKVITPPSSATSSNPSQKVHQMGIKRSNIWTCEVHFHSSCHKGWQTILKDNINPLFLVKTLGNLFSVNMYGLFGKYWLLVFEEIGQSRLKYYSKKFSLIWSVL